MLMFFLACKFLLLVKNYNNHLKIHTTRGRQNIPSLTIKQISWKPPLQHWIKVNTDGSLLGNLGTTTCGGVMRDHKSIFKAAWSMNLGDLLYQHGRNLGCVLWP